MTLIWSAAIVLASLAVSCATAAAFAQVYPTRPITLIVPYTAGGGNDAMARVVADRMGVSLGQQIVIENRGGAGGSIKFADMALKLEGAQLLLYRAATNADCGFPSAYETSLAKAACNLAGFEVAHEAIQAMGALGYSSDTLVEYCMRRCRGWMIAGGSVEILKNRIAEDIFDRRFDQRGRRADAAE